MVYYSRLASSPRLRRVPSRRKRGDDVILASVFAMQPLVETRRRAVEVCRDCTREKAVPHVVQRNSSRLKQPDSFFSDSFLPFESSCYSIPLRACNV